MTNASFGGAVAMLLLGGCTGPVPGVGIAGEAISTGALSYHGGKVISKVHVTPVFWGPSVAPLIQSEAHCFYSALVQSPFMDALAEYNTPTQDIGRGSVGANVTITPNHTALALSDADIEHELAAQLDAGTLPPTDDNALYMVHFPTGLAITERNGKTLCVPDSNNREDVAYHYAFSHGGKRVRYGVMAACPLKGAIKDLAFASHELAEAVTDPDPSSGWYSDSNGEIGDFCEKPPFVALPGTNYQVTQIWSNGNAACIAPPSGPTTTEAPRINTFTPATGAFDKNSGATLTGSCLANPIVTVTLGGRSVPVRVTSQPQPNSSDTIIRAGLSLPPSPDGLPGVATLFLSNGDGAGPVTQTFTYGPTGMLTVDPASGPMQGTTAVTIQGGPFPVGGTIGVTFGGVAATGVQCPTSTTCTAYVPPHDPGSVDVVVTVQGVAQTVANQYTYDGPHIVTVTPPSGPIAGGTHLSIYGTNLADVSENGFLATATIGGVPLGSISCVRADLFDAICDLVTPAVAAPTTADIAITIKHVTGSLIGTAPEPADQFVYTALPALAGLSFSGNAVGGATVTGTVVLNGNAPPAGSRVSLALDPSSPSGAVQFPSGVLVQNGASASFPLQIVNQNFTGSVTLVATYNGSEATATLSVTPVPPPTLAPIGTLCAGQRYNATITFAEPAPMGAQLLLSSSSSAVASVPPFVQLFGGETTVTFAVMAGSPSVTSTATISASYLGITANPVSVTVLPSAAVTLSLPASVTGGLPATGTVTLCTSPPRGGATVTLSSASGVATPTTASVWLATGTTAASVTFNTQHVTTAQYATVSASYLGATSTRTLVVKPVVTCPSGQQLCTCSTGAQACLANVNACLAYCR